MEGNHLFEFSRPRQASARLRTSQSCLTPLHQRGQAILLILLVTVVCVLLGLSLVNIGIVTSEKMQLQNAADAAAYSVSTIEARDLNFTAYTNRAMVANEVAIGQMVGLMSWAVMADSTPDFIDLYLQPIYRALDAAGAATFGITTAISTALQATIQAMNTATGVIRQVVRGFTTIGSTALWGLNQAYSTAQRGMHVATLYFSLTTLLNMIESNADDAKLSLFSYFTLGRHVTSHYGDLAFPLGDSFITSYRQDNRGFANRTQLRSPPPTDNSQKEGMERFAALINASRDPFSKERKCFFLPGNICQDPNGGWKLGLSSIPFPIRFPITISIPNPFGGAALVSFSLDFDIRLNRQGGSDMRYVKRSVGNEEEQRYSWTAVDTIDAGITFGIEFAILGLDIINLRVTLGVPLGIGGAQAANTDNSADRPNEWLPDWSGGEVDENAYGGTPYKFNPAWLWASPAPGDGGPFFAVRNNNINTSYSGLPRYNDTKDGPDPINLNLGADLKLGFESPYLLIGLVKDMDNVSQSESTGRFRLDPATPPALAGPTVLGDLPIILMGNSLAVIGKSEVYFSRPNDMFASHFHRADGATELANGFNPYWEARLVDTSYIDRTTALAFQQGQPWVPQLPQGVNQLIQSIRNLIDALRFP